MEYISPCSGRTNLGADPPAARSTLEPAWLYVDAEHQLDDQTGLVLLEAPAGPPVGRNSHPGGSGARRNELLLPQLLARPVPRQTNLGRSEPALLCSSRPRSSTRGQDPAVGALRHRQAVAALSLQAEAIGLSAHQMGGFGRSRGCSSVRPLTPPWPGLWSLRSAAATRRTPPEPYAARETGIRAARPVQPLLSSLLLAPPRPDWPAA